MLERGDKRTGDYQVQMTGEERNGLCLRCRNKLQQVLPLYETFVFGCLDPRCYLVEYFFGGRGKRRLRQSQTYFLFAGAFADDGEKEPFALCAVRCEAIGDYAVFLDCLNTPFSRYSE